jgi:polyisoprenoid-binding protein YceI
MLNSFRLLLAGTLVLGAVTLAHAQSSTWKIDPAHSATGFTVRHMRTSANHR